MKKVFIISCLLFSLQPFKAQDSMVEKEIRMLEQQEVEAVFNKDSAMLLKLWHPHFTVNAPNNVVVGAGTTTLDRPALVMPRIAFTRTVEKVFTQGDTVFSMGSETVLQPAAASGKGSSVKRRYTNIWMKQSGEWKLVARHANVICQAN